MFAIVEGQHGRGDILFANAGGGELARLADAKETHFHRWFYVNVKGVFRGAEGAPPDPGRRLDNSERFNRRQQGPAREQRLFGDKSRCAIFCAYMDD